MDIIEMEANSSENHTDFAPKGEGEGGKKSANKFLFQDCPSKNREVPL
jgi:hypothetical protein